MQTIAKPPPKTGNARYVVEHVLEANVIQSFFKSLSDADATCKDLMKYHFQDGRMALGVRPIDHVGGGWPNKDINAQRDEMFYVIETINLMKEKLWQGKKFNGQDRMATLVQTEDSMPSAIKTMKFALMTYEYMKMQEVGQILIDQTDRVAGRFDEAEEWMRQDSGNKYRVRGLGDKFKAFVKGRFSVVMGKLDSFFDQYDPLITGILDNTDAAQDSADRAELRRRIAAVHNAIDDIKDSWTNPFP